MADYVIHGRTRRSCTTRLRRWSERGWNSARLISVDSTLEMWYQPRRGWMPTSLTIRRGGQVTEQKFPSLKVLMMKRKVVGKSQPKDGVAHLAPLESQVFQALHSLVAHCAVVRYEDGESRKPGWITIKTMGAAWIIQLKDPDAAAQLQVVGDTLDNALALASMMLDSDDAPWEPDPFAKRTQAKKAG